MQNFESVEDLVAQMFKRLDGDDPVSIVADKDLAVAILQELFEYENVILSFAEVDTYNYDKEYIVSLYDDTDTDYWYVSIEQMYDYEKDMYFGTDGYILFHEDVNSKALVDMQNNENIGLSGYDWFVISEDDDETDDNVEESDISTVNDNTAKVDDKLNTISKATYTVNGKEVSREFYEKTLNNIENMHLDNMKDILLRYAEIMDEMNEWRKLIL